MNFTNFSSRVCRHFLESVFLSNYYFTNLNVAYVKRKAFTDWKPILCPCGAAVVPIRPYFPCLWKIRCCKMFTLTAAEIFTHIDCLIPLVRLVICFTSTFTTCCCSSRDDAKRIFVPLLVLNECCSNLQFFAPTRCLARNLPFSAALLLLPRCC